MLLATSEAFVTTFGLLILLVGIGLVVNIIVIYIIVQIRGERRQNREYLESRQPPGI